MAHINWETPFFIDPHDRRECAVWNTGRDPLPHLRQLRRRRLFRGRIRRRPHHARRRQPVRQQVDEANANGTGGEDAVDIIDYFSYVHDVRSSAAGPSTTWPKPRPTPSCSARLSRSIFAL